MLRGLVRASAALILLALTSSCFKQQSTEEEIVTAKAQESRLGDLSGRNGSGPEASFDPLYEAQIAGPSGPPDGEASLHRKVVIGELDFSRLLATDIDYLIGAARRNESKMFKADRISTVVGAAISVVAIGDDLVIASTNHAELVLLMSDNWEEPRTLALAPLLRSGEAPLNFGTLLHWKGSVIVPVGFGETVALVKVDLERWALGAHRRYPDRFESLPPACLTSDGVLALAVKSVEDWSSRLDLLNPDTLERRGTVPLPGSRGGVACIEDQIWTTDSDSSDGQVFLSSGRAVGSFVWNGRRDAFELIADPSQGKIFGSDRAAGVVFACAVRDRACQTSARVGRKPTNLLVHGESLFITLEQSSAVGLLDARSLTLLGRAGFPGTPRTLTYIE